VENALLEITVFNFFPLTDPGIIANGTCFPKALPKSGTGSPTRQCFGNGVWSTSVVNTCFNIQCPAIQAGGATFPATNWGTTTHGNCPQGTTGRPTMTCDDNAHWESVIGACV